MEAIRLPAALTACALVIMLLRQQRPEFAAIATMAAGTASFFLLKDDLAAIVQWISQAGTAIRAPNEAMSIMLKAGGVALISEFASDLCSDAGEKALAGRIDLAERVVLTGMCIPLAAQMLDRMAEILP